jgi:hypothetical protein
MGRPAARARWVRSWNAGCCERQQAVADKGTAEGLSSRKPQPGRCAASLFLLLLVGTYRPRELFSLFAGYWLPGLPGFERCRSTMPPRAGQRICLEPGGLHIVARPQARKPASRRFMMGSGLHRADARFAGAVVPRPGRRREELPNSLPAHVTGLRCADRKPESCAASDIWFKSSTDSTDYTDSQPG